MASAISAQEEWFAQRRRQFVQKVSYEIFIKFKPSQVRYRSSVQLKGSLERRSQSCNSS